LAEVVCSKMATCNSWSMTLLGWTEATCRVDEARLCETTLSSPGVNRDYAGWEQCMNAISAASCDAYAYGPTPAACELTGTLPDGAACDNGSQCQGSSCSVHAVDACGTCQTRGGLGAACGAEGQPMCASELACFNSTCVKPKNLGETCTTHSDCRGMLDCVAGVCTKPAISGEACDTSTRHCAGGLECGSSGTCVPLVLPRLGEACTSLCQGGALCNTKVTPRVCVAARQEGESCSDTGADPCTYFLECVNGTCQYPAPSQCGA
jgi:hypothetical protein